MLELRQIDPLAHRIIWHHRNDERREIERAVPGIATVWGSQDMEKREDIIARFSAGEIQELATKPVIAGSGCNFQRHCAWAIFVGIGFKFNDFIQAIHRIQRFLQTKRVRIDLIYTEAEREVRRILEAKWEKHNKLMAEMATIIREFGLARASLMDQLQRGMGVERVEVEGSLYRLIHNDCVDEARRLESNSIHHILTSIPFSTQYEYSPNYADFGHTNDNDHFWEQMGYLIPELFRALKPGRIAAIHVKDRIVPGGINKLGFQTVYPFHVDAIERFTKNGFAYIGMKTIVTDVVRENNQTYRLGWSEQCKDGTKMGVGMPEYLLLFRKPPTSSEKSYADEPVVKAKGTYSRGRWQIDAHGFTRSSGDRLLRPEDLKGMTHKQIFQAFKKSLSASVYDFAAHVALCEELDRCEACGHLHVGSRSCARDGCDCTKPPGRLPSDFMLLQPPSWSDEVWSDVTRMTGMNSLQAAKNRELHLCPMQFDIADRSITQFTNPGELVFDPFAGLGTVPYRAVLMGRRGLGVELSPTYFADSCHYLKAAEAEVSMPTLFDFAEEEAAA